MLDIDENNSYILNHEWHGNVRELRNLIERIAILQPNTQDKISNIIKERIENGKEPTTKIEWFIEPTFVSSKGYIYESTKIYKETPEKKT